MGLVGSIIHLGLKTVLASLMLWFILVLYMDIPMDKVPMLLLLVLMVNAVASLVSSLLLGYKRGY